MKQILHFTEDKPEVQGINNMLVDELARPLHSVAPACHSGSRNNHQIGNFLAD